MGDEQVRVSADVVSVEELFKEGAGAKLRVPSYQRGYAWKTDQVVALCRDILTAKDSGRREYPTGTLVLHENGEWLDIVDGQQRLSTICMLSGYKGVLTVQSGEGALHFDSGEMAFGKLSETAAEILLKEVNNKIGGGLANVQDYLPHCTFVRITVNNVDEAFQLFDTQNGRGRPLTPANLLKAYHFHEMERGGIGKRPEVKRERQYALEGMWENINQDGILNDLFNLYLFRLRLWSRGEDASQIRFDKTQLKEFKGVTLGDGEGVSPCHGEAFLRRFFRRQYSAAGLEVAGMPSRLGEGGRNPVGLDPFSHIVQPIVNGEEFFLYVETFATAYKMLFGKMEVKELESFRSFYEENCRNYAKSWQGTGVFSRYVFEALCLLLFDRFGVEGLLAHYKLMYRVAYWECRLQNRVWNNSPGKQFAKPAVRAMIASETLAELGEAYAELNSRLDENCENDRYDEAFAKWYHLPKEQLKIVNPKLEEETGK